jgi:hypothetical protein
MQSFEKRLPALFSAVSMKMVAESVATNEQRVYILNFTKGC